MGNSEAKWMLDLNQTKEWTNIQSDPWPAIATETIATEDPVTSIQCGLAMPFSRAAQV